MSGRRVGPALRLLAAIGLALLIMAFLGACDDGSESARPTDTQESGRERPTATPNGTPAPASESGQAPVYWRTEDDFRSLRAGKPYKVLFRITNGYDEATLRIVAECLSCADVAEDSVLEFEATQAEAVGQEDSGSFYPFSLELPRPGTWQLTVVAGDDQVAIPVPVQPAG